MWVETLSWEPRAFLYHNFLTLQECEHIIGLGRPTLAKSTVIDNETGRSVDSRCPPPTSWPVFAARLTPLPPGPALSLAYSLHLPQTDSLLCSACGAAFIVL